MLIELGTDRVSSLKRRTFKTVQGTVAGLLGFVGTYSISPNIISAEPLFSPTAKVLDYSPRFSLDPYTQCGGEGYEDNETVLITPQEDESLTSESLGIMPGECGNPLPQEASSLIVETILPTPTPVPTPTPIIFPRYPQIPLPTPDARFNQRPIIRGNAECMDKMNSSLDLLKERTPTEYYLVISNFGILECTDDQVASARPHEDPPRGTFGKVFLSHSKASLASVLTHEACHSWQYRRFRVQYPTVWPPPAGISEGKIAEAECYTVEYYLLTKMGATSLDLSSFSDWAFQLIGIRIPLQ